MKIEYKEITVSELVKDYTDSNENGITAYNGALDIRPPYQREFVYKDRQRDAVIHTIKNGFPLNVMYWAVRTDDTFEIIDGQQRTISICQYVNCDFSLDKMFFHNLQSDQKDKILDYKLHIYLCSGEDSEKLDWFETINIAGEKLAKQELRNAIYAGDFGCHLPKSVSVRATAPRTTSAKNISLVLQSVKITWKLPSNG